jgi:hypothetical protein
VIKMRGENVLEGMLFICAVILLSTIIMPISIANAEDTADFYVENYGPLRIATMEEPAYSGDHSYTADTLQTPDNPSSGTMLKALIWPPLGKSISSPITKVRVVTYIDCIDGDYNSQSLEYRLYAYNMETGKLTRKIHDDTWPRTGNTPTYFPLSYGLKTYDDTIICDTNKSALGENETLILLSICHHFGAKSRHTKYAAHFDTNDYPAYMEVFTSEGKSTKYYIHDSFTTPTVDGDGLLAYYPFNGNANDESGNGLHGSVYGATLTEDRFGNADNAFLFDNPTTIDTNRIVVTDGYGFNGGDTLESLTISSWFLPYMQSDECSYLLRFASTDGIGHLHFYRDGRVSFGLRTVDAGIINQMVSAGVSLDNWHHVAGTWDGSTMKLYVDGVFRYEATFPWTLSTPPNPIGNTIGANFNPDPNVPEHVCSFNGKIDEVRIYNRALTESEIKALYDGQKGGCGRITNWKTMCQGVYSPGQKVGAEMEFENLMGGGYNFKGVIIIRSPTGDEYTNSEVEWVPSAPNPEGKFAAGDALYVTIPEGASAGKYDVKLELWNDDTDELCDETEWKDDLFTVGKEDTDAVLIMNFDEGSGTVAKDSSGNGNDGTIHGATWTTGVSGKALSFDGVDDYVEIPHSDSLTILRDITVEFWIKPNVIPDEGNYWNVLIFWEKGENEDNNAAYSIHLGNEGRIRFWHEYGTGINEEQETSNAYITSTEKFYHIVITRNCSSKQKQFYVDGALKETVSYINDGTGASNSLLYIGSAGDSNSTNGIIDEVRIYNRALTESEIRALYEQGGDITPSNLLENTGFESGELDPWYSTKYYDPYKKCDWINIGVDREARYEGDYGAYIDILCSLDAWGRIIQEPVEITPGEKLAVEAKLMYEGDLNSGYAELWLVFLDVDKKSLDHVYKKYYESDFGAEDKWLSAVLPATTAPSNAKYVRIMVGLADVKSCRLNIDGVILKYGSAIGNHPPTATKIEPTSDSITIEPGATQEFKVKAEDVDEEEHNNLKMIEWFVDDVLVETDAADGTSAEASFSYTFENAGMFSVKATVYDEQMEKDSVTWEVNVGEDVGLIEKEILDKDGNEIGLKVRIEYPTTLSVKESGNSERGWLDIQLKTKDFEDATFADDYTNLKSGYIMIASDEDMYVYDVEFEVAPVPQTLHREAFGWKDYIPFLKQEKNEWGVLAVARIAELIMKIFPGSSQFFWAIDLLSWNPLEDIEYDIGGKPIDVSFYDKNNYDTWEYPWTFNLNSIAWWNKEKFGNGVHLRLPFVYEKAGKYEIHIFLFIDYSGPSGSSDLSGIIPSCTIGKEYTCDINVG